MSPAMSLSLNNLLSIKLIGFFMKFAGVWTSSSSMGARILKFATIFALSANLIMVFIVLIDIYYCHSNFDEIANGFLNFSIAGMSSYKLAVIIPIRERFIDLISQANKNFWSITYDRNDLRVMNEFMTKCTYMVVFISFMCIMALLTYMVEPFISHTNKDGIDRKLPVNLHFSFIPISTTPWYEILFIIQFSSGFYCAICFLCFDTFLCGINMTLVGQFTILQTKLQAIYDHTESTMLDEDNICLRFIKFVRIHQELIACADNVRELYKNFVIGFVFFLSLLIGMELFQIMMSADLYIRLRGMLYVCNTTGQLYLFTFACNSLAEVSFEVSNAAYGVRWHSIRSDRVKKKLMAGLQIVIMRSQKPCQMMVGNFAPVTLKTFTSICNTAFSCLTLMRTSIQREN
ncbi:odorant receptor 67c-like [Diachasmimorpha longicaudata]|uniref:odorant receptor 67c-like n=1 Tax=Diachasmimorpha longicaudata TaxID=58733 RepID=UPI0030B87306